MAIGTMAAIGMGVSAVGGAIKGARGSSTTSSVNLRDPSALENQAEGISGRQLATLEDFLGAGPGKSDIAAGTGATRDLAAQLLELQETGGLPGEQDVAAGRDLASLLFQGQRENLKQSFEDQRMQAAQNRAVAGRGGTDPVLAAKLSQEQTRQRRQVDTAQGAQAAQIAQALPQQRLQFGAARAEVLSGLGQQAFANRQAVQQLGAQQLAQERAFRAQTAGKTVEKPGGGFLGGLAGGLTGALGGFGAGASADASIASAGAFDRIGRTPSTTGAPTGGFDPSKLA